MARSRTQHEPTALHTGGPYIRTDVTYTPQPGHRFVLEVKRHTKAYSHEGVERDYLAQAANYTATGPPFGMLLVGDHSNHQGGYSRLR